MSLRRVRWRRLRQGRYRLDWMIVSDGMLVVVKVARTVHEGPDYFGHEKSWSREQRCEGMLTSIHHAHWQAVRGEQ